MKMKYGSLFLLVFFIFVSFTSVIKVNAVNTGFKTNQLPAEEKNMIISNINISLINEEPVKKAIICFDINSNQLVAIGQNTSDRKTICVYSKEGVFQWGYTFNCSGDFGVEWDEETLNIYLVRSGAIISVTSRGEVLDVLEVQNTIYNNSYVNHFIHATKRTIDNEEYFVRNNLGFLNLFASAYSQIIVKDSTGAESIIYDVGSMQLADIIVIIGSVCLIVFVTMAGISQQLKTSKPSPKGQGDGSVVT